MKDGEIFKAKIVKDFKRRWIEWVLEDQPLLLTSKEYAEEYYNHDGALDKLSDRISGKITTLKRDYHVYKVCVFEVIDNDFVIPPELYEEIEKREKNENCN